MALRLEPGQIYHSWEEFRTAFELHCEENKVLFNIANAKTVEQANALLKKPPHFDEKLKYASCVLRCKHFGSYTSLSQGMRPKQRSYKTDCRAFINVSACRKAGYLIVRDSYHLHTHPCTEEIYNSYPEVRRMSIDEKKMVGTLIDMGVPISEIKNAVGRSVTHKDLHNARSNLKKIKNGESPVAKKRSYTEIQAIPTDVLESTSGEVVTVDFYPLKNVKLDKSSYTEIQTIPAELLESTSREVVAVDYCPLKKVKLGADIDELENKIENKVGSSDYSILGATDGALDGGEDMAADSSDQTLIPTDISTDSNNLSGLLTAAGISSESVVVTVNQGGISEVDEQGKVDLQPKNSYTVTISLPDRDVTHTGTDLQELLKGLPLKGLEASKETSGSLIATPKTEEGTGKNCLKCNSYMSPLDGHSLCLHCLGPDHLLLKACIHCTGMKPEQLSIRRKQLVRQRMKALKALQENVTNSDSSGSLDSVNVRKSQRIRKPKDYGPDIVLEKDYGKGINSEKKSFIQETLKCEQIDEFEIESLDKSLDESEINEITNSQRFEHMVQQASLMEDVNLEELPNGSLQLIPNIDISEKFTTVVGLKNPPAFPAFLDKKYGLYHKFESKYCSDVSDLSNVTDPGIKALSGGLCKLAKNAAVQTRLTLYGKLFNKLGVSMADEALSILGDMYGKVTKVTEISQEDLTNDIQTALDTIQALKDVLEELGVMSTDAVSTAALQRSISINSLKSAKNSMNQKVGISDTSSVGITRRKKFQPFSRPMISSASTSKLEVDAIHSTSGPQESLPEVLSLPSQYMKHLVVNVSSGSEFNSPVCLPLNSNHQHSDPDTHQTHSCEDPTNNISISNKDFSMELLQTLQGGKDGVIELIQGKENVLQLHQGSKEFLQTLEDNKESVIEFHQPGIQSEKENVIELHVVDGQLIGTDGETIAEGVQSQVQSINIETNKLPSF